MREIGSVDHLVCLGDSIYQYEFSNEVVGLLKEKSVATIWGNHEELFFGPSGQRARSASSIDSDLVGWLAERPRELVLTIEGKTLFLVHSTPWHPRGEYVTAESRNFERMAETEADFLLYGHTHRPLVRKVSKTLVINPGSVGEGDPAANFSHSCAVLDTVTADIRLIRFQ
jgi:putative phosphoesterase